MNASKETYELFERYVKEFKEDIQKYHWDLEIRGTSMLLISEMSTGKTIGMVCDYEPSPVLNFWMGYKYGYLAGEKKWKKS